MPKKQHTYSKARDINVYEFIERIQDEKAAEKYLIQALWKGEPACPRCGSAQASETKEPQTYHCRDCWKRFNVRTSLVLAQQSNLSFRKILYVICLMARHPEVLSELQFAREFGVTPETARFLAHWIRKARQQKGGMFAGPVKVDESYFGGKENNKRSNRKPRAGCGAVGKQSVVDASVRRGGGAKACQIAKTDAEELQGFIRETAKPGEMAYTDNHRGYTGLVDFEHQSVRHSVGEYVQEQAHTSGIKSFCAPLKRGYCGTYHSNVREASAPLC